MKWLEMDAERRDRLVAEKVMGWTEQLCNLDNGSLDIAEIEGWWECRICGFQGDWGYDYVNYVDRHIAPPPRYSQSLDVAWKIIDYLTLEGESYLNARRNSFIAYLKNMNWWALGSQALIDAICIAALRCCDIAIED